MRRFIYIFAIGIAFFPLSGHANDIPDKMIVAELFTSQSCASCPAADRVLAEISKKSNVIALSCHVAYWNHLDWKDTLSKPFCSERQKAYNTYRGEKRAYTPQLIINGQAEMIGSDRQKVLHSIMNTSTQGAPKIGLIPSKSNQLQVILPSIIIDSYQLTLIGYQTRHTQHITAGENKGRTVSYHNVIRYMRNAGPWNGMAHHQNIDISAYQKAGLDGIVVIAQSIQTGHIQAAGRYIFNNNNNNL